MKKLSFLILFIFLISSFKNPLLPSHTLADYDLKGKVKTSINILYSVDSKTQEKTYFSTKIYCFSEKGLIEKEVVFYGKDTLDCLIYYHYENDKLKSIENYYCYESSSPSSEKFLYNPKNQLIQRNSYQDNQLTSTRRYEYDSLKNTIEEEEFFNLHNDISIDFYSSIITFYFFQSEDKSINLNIDDYTSDGDYLLYDKDTNLIEYKANHHNLLYKKYNYKYNSDGLKIQEIKYFERRQRKTIFNFTYQYDENKDLRVFTTKDEEDIIRVQNYLEYDENKNWIISTITDEDTARTLETYRKIIYY